MNIVHKKGQLNNAGVMAAVAVAFPIMMLIGSVGRIFDLKGVIYSQPLEDGLTLIVSLILFIRIIKELKKIEGI